MLQCALLGQLKPLAGRGSSDKERFRERGAQCRALSYVEASLGRAAGVSVRRHHRPKAQEKRRGLGQMKPFHQIAKARLGAQRIGHGIDVEVDQAVIAFFVGLVEPV